MIYIETNSENVYYNFAMEYYFASEKILPDTAFLFWRTSPTLMVGKYQNVLEEINKPYTDKNNISLVRRMSGGGTIYTDMGGWQFTFIQQKKTQHIEFNEYISPVIDALQNLGINAAFNGRNDLTIEGKKFSGNAQYHMKNTIVHHGSLLFNTNIEQMVSSTTVDDYKIISKSIKSVRDRVTNISDHMSTDITPTDFKNHMISYIMQGSQKRYLPTEEDIKRINEIAEEKFNNWNSIYGSSPAFNIERTGYLAGGKIQFKIDVQRGTICGVSIYGDFFSPEENICAIKKCLTGCKYEKGAILHALQKNTVQNSIYKMTIEELAGIIAD